MNLKRASEVGAVGHAVRRAMYRTLSLDRYLKTLSGNNRPRIVALFGSIGYDGYVLSEGTMRPLADGDTKDIVFVHRSRRERYQKLIRP